MHDPALRIQSKEEKYGIFQALGAMHTIFKHSIIHSEHRYCTDLFTDNNSWVSVEK